MTRRRPFLSSFLFSVCVLLSAACGSDDESCDDGSCEREERDNTSEPTEPAPPTLPCRPACEALTGSCDHASGDPTEVRAVAACIDWCEAGGLTTYEATCLESADCDSADSCLAD